jgi:hypothetical protein
MGGLENVEICRCANKNITTLALPHRKNPVFINFWFLQYNLNYNFLQKLLQSIALMRFQAGFLVWHHQASSFFFLPPSTAIFCKLLLSAANPHKPLPDDQPEKYPSIQMAYFKYSSHQSFVWQLY